MSLAEELLASVSETVSEHDHAVIDSDTYFVIDPDTREIDNTASRRNYLMQYDHDSERYTFEVARYVEGHDMSLCNRVRVHYMNVGTDGDSETEETTTVKSYADLVELDDLHVDPENEDVVLCSWLISRQATQLAGELNFLVQYMCVSDIGTVDYEWHSDIYDNVEVKDGRNNGEAVIIEYTDLVEQWRTKLFGAGTSAIAEITINAELQLQAIEDEGAKQVAAVTAEGESQLETITSEGTAQYEAIKAEGEAQISAIEAKGAETLESIPDDYTELYNNARQALRTRANAIVETAEGEVITIDDSSDDYLRGMKLYGKSTQVTTTGKNLLDVKDAVTWTGVYSKDISIPAGRYTMSYSSSSWGGENAPYVRFTANDKWIMVGATAGTAVLVLEQDEDHLYMYSNGSSASDSESITATINQLMVSVNGGDYEAYTGGMASPNPDYPQEIESVENPSITIVGKNIFDWTEAINNNFVESNGVWTMTRNAGDSRFSDAAPIHVPANTPVTVSMNVVEYIKASKNVPFYFTGESGTSYYGSTSDSFTRTYSEPLIAIRFYLQSTEEVGAYIKFEKLQVELGDVATEYEPYESTQTLALTRTLPGIPVTSGGNYTDSNGQQWICDEIDFERGMYIQRVKSATYNGESSEYISKYGLKPNSFAISNKSDDYLCPLTSEETVCAWCDKLTASSTAAVYRGETDAIFGLSISGRTIRFTLNTLTEYTADQVREWLTVNPLTFYYILATPIETALTEEELYNFSQLHSNYPNTTVFNDHGVKMEVGYNADTKTYFNNSRGASDEQVQASVDAWLTAYFASAEEASF